MDRDGIRDAYKDIMAIGFLSTGMMALISFPRSLCLVDVGISVAIYGLLISISNVFVCLFNIALGVVIDKYDGLEKVLNTSILLSVLGHFTFAVTEKPQILALAFVLDTTACKVFTTFIYKAIAAVSGDNYGANLGKFKIAGSVAWVLFAATSGYIVSFFSFKILVVIVIGMGILKIFLLRRLFDFYHKISHIKNQKTVKVPIVFSAGLINLMFLYMLMQFQSNGGFSYLQIFFSKDLGLDNIVSGYIISSSGFFEIFISVFVGKYCDISVKASQKAVIAGCALSAIRWLILAESDSVVLLVFTQFLHGVMICTINITFMSYLGRIVKEESLGTMMGIMGAISSFGTIFGAGIFGFFSQRYTLKAAYTGLGVISVIGVLVYMLSEHIAASYKQTRYKRCLSKIRKEKGI